MGKITRDTPLAQMTVGQLLDFIKSDYFKEQLTEFQINQAEDLPVPRYVYGLKGIMQLFNVSNVTAQRYKNGIIKDAVKQYGRKIVVDADKALELFKAARQTAAEQGIRP